LFIQRTNLFIRHRRTNLFINMNTVKVYTTPACHWCHTLKDFLKNNNVEYTEIDVSRDRAAAREMIERSGQMGVPVSEINGQIVVGFDEERIKKLLDIK